MLLTTSVALATAACGAKGPAAPAGPAPCATAATQLKARLGPELAGVDTRLTLPLGPTSRGGCALVYRTLAEESPDELEDADIGGPEQHLAISLPDTRDQQVLTLQSAAEAAPGPVAIKISLKDVTGNGRPELVAVEDAGTVGDAYRGLRVFTYAAGASAAREVFSERLVIKTPEGLELIPEWRAGSVEAKRAILLDGAGTFRIFTWAPSTQTFAFDEAATAARNPKPAAPPAAPGSDGLPADATPDAPTDAPAPDAKGPAAAPASDAPKVPTIELP